MLLTEKHIIVPKQTEVEGPENHFSVSTHSVIAPTIHFCISTQYLIVFPIQHVTGGCALGGAKALFTA